jgi:hypothetical protein
VQPDGGRYRLATAFQSIMIRKLTRLTPRDWLLLTEATLSLTAASIALRMLPFRKVVETIAMPEDGPEQDVARLQAEVARIRWAVEAAARRLPWRIVCFQKGLAAQRILRRHNLPAHLHYGIARQADGELKAHVWVTSDAYPVVGHEAASEFARVATFPSSGGGQL